MTTQISQSDVCYNEVVWQRKYYTATIQRCSTTTAKSKEEQRQEQRREKGDKCETTLKPTQKQNKTNKP